MTVEMLLGLVAALAIWMHCKAHDRRFDELEAKSRLSSKGIREEYEKEKREIEAEKE